MKKTTLALLLSIQAFSAFAGVKEVGNGAEDVKKFSAGAAWFYRRNRTLQTCITMDENFEKVVSKKRAENAIRWAFSKWNEYAQAKGVRLHQSQSELYFPQTIAVSPVCNGSEDLNFKFGTFDDDVNSFIKKYSRPVSFAVRTSFDIKQIWSKGFVWIAPQAYLDAATSDQPAFPDWSMSFNLEGILLHEIGHIYGNAHSEGTIMDENIAGTLRMKSDSWRKKVFSEIDFRRELLICTQNCHYEQGGLLGGWVNIGSNPINQEPLNFQLLMNRPPVGKVHAKVRIYTGRAYLDVSDEKGQETFELVQKKGDSASRGWGPPTFKVAWAEPLAGTGAFYSGGAESLCMYLTTLSGRKISIRVERNVGGFQFNQKISDNNWHPVSTELIHILLDDPEEVRVLFGAQFYGSDAY